MSETFDLAIVGAGTGGSLLAAIARRLGRSVVLIDKARHPRFAAGELATPLANSLLVDLADRYELPEVRELAGGTTGTAGGPAVVTPIGSMSFEHHPAGDANSAPEPTSVIAVEGASLWFRPATDQKLTNMAIAAGAEYLDQTRLAKLTAAADGVRIAGSRAGAEVEISARFLVDASGPRGFLHHAVGSFNRGFNGFPNTQSLQGYFKGATAASDSATHHVFDGGWLWDWPIGNTVTSVGLVVTDEMAGQLRLATADKAWARVCEMIPAVGEQFAAATLLRPFTYTRRVSYLASALTGPSWAMLPATAGYVDPLLETSFPLTLWGVERLAKLFQGSWGTEEFSIGLAQYANTTERELTTVAALIAELYRQAKNPTEFRLLVQLYVDEFAKVGTNAEALDARLNRRVETPLRFSSISSEM